MTTAQLVSDVYYKATGKAATFASGSTKWLKIVALANQNIRNWAQETGVDWNSLYNPLLSIGTVTATDTFSIPGTVRKISDQAGDQVVINHSNGVNQTFYDVVPIDRLKDYYTGQNKENFYSYVCAQQGSNLVFNHKFTSADPQFGGTILIPAYSFPTELSADTDVVPVTDPMWLVYATAAEYIRNDITRQNQYPNIIGQANELMQRMKDDNDAQLDEIERPWQPMGANW